MENDIYKVVLTRDVHGNQVIVPLTDSFIDKVLNAIRERGKAEKRWDINVEEGKLAERSLLRLLSTDGTTIEVKRDFKSAETGNIAIEGMYKDGLSGIMITEAEWWAYVLDGKGYGGEVVILIKTGRLRKLISKIKPIKGGDNNTASIKLLPVIRLLEKIQK